MTATSPLDPPVYLLVTQAYLQFHGTVLHLVLLLFVPQLPKYGIPYRLTFCSLKHCLHSDVIWRHTTFHQPILSPSRHPECAL